MNILAVDDERAPLTLLKSAILEAAPDAAVHAVQDAEEAVRLAQSERIDVAFLDIRLRETSGLALAETLHGIRKTINIVFVTGYAEFLGDAFHMHASGYIQKPVTGEDVRHELENLRYPIGDEGREARLRVQCFGNFEVFYDGRPMKFAYAKSKELFAYLIDRRGASVTVQELCAVLWEDRSASASQKSQLRKLYSVLYRTLRQIGAEGVLYKSRNCYAVATERIDCDYYAYLARDGEAAARLFCGAYMTQYSWAEMTLGELERQSLR